MHTHMCIAYSRLLLLIPGWRFGVSILRTVTLDCELVGTLSATNLFAHIFMLSTNS